MRLLLTQKWEHFHKVMVERSRGWKPRVSASLAGDKFSKLAFCDVGMYVSSKNTGPLCGCTDYSESAWLNLWALYKNRLKTTKRACFTNHKKLKTAQLSGSHSFYKRRYLNVRIWSAEADMTITIPQELGLTVRPSKWATLENRRTLLRKTPRNGRLARLPLRI